jgi:hypothetical protein
MRSVRSRRRKRIAAHQRQAASVPSWRSSAQANTGTSRIRPTVKALGRFQLDTRGAGAGLIAGWPRDPLLTSRQCGPARALRPAHGDRRSGASHRRCPALGRRASDKHPSALVEDSTSTSTSSPTRRAARSAVNCSTRSVRGDAVVDDVLVKLAVVIGRLRPVLVAVAEDTDDIEVRRLQEVGHLLDVVLGLAGEADDDIGADPAVGASASGCARSGRGSRPCHRSAASAAAVQTGGVLEGNVEPRHDLVGREHRLEQPGPDLGRLQIGHPHPLQAVDSRQTRQQLLQRPEVARDPCRMTWSSR